jgi:hypothetical protein
VGEVAPQVVGIQPERLGDGWVHPPPATFDLVGRDQRVGGRVVALLVDEPDRVEDLHNSVGVEARHGLRDRAEVPVDELAQTPVVVDRARPGASGDEELEVRDAERVLDVHGEEAHAMRVVARARHVVLGGPLRGLFRALPVRHPPYLADAARLEVGRNR